MYKYTYIQAAGDKRITKRHKVRLLTIGGKRQNGRGTGGAVAAGRNQEHAHRRAEHHAHHAHHGITYTRPRARAGGWLDVVQAGGLPSCSSCWLDICRLFLTARRGRYSLSARNISPENAPKNKAAGRTARKALKKPPTMGG